MGRSSLVDRMVSIYRIVLAFGSLHVRNDEAFGGCNKVSRLLFQNIKIGNIHSGIADFVFLRILHIFVCKNYTMQR